MASDPPDKISGALTEILRKNSHRFFLTDTFLTDLYLGASVRVRHVEHHCPASLGNFFIRGPFRN